LIDKMVGVGGWDAAVIETLKGKLNARMWRGPLSLMDALVEEIETLQAEGGVSIPKTPTLPFRNKRIFKQ